MSGWRPVGAVEADYEGYWAWVAHKGFTLPANRQDAWLPKGVNAVMGPTALPSRIPTELSDSAFFTDRALSYLKGRAGKPFVLHLGYYRPHPPFIVSAPYNAMYDPMEMARPRRAASIDTEAKQHPLLAWYLANNKKSDFFPGAAGPASQLTEQNVLQMRATYCGLMTEVDDQIGKVFAFLDETGQWDDTAIVFTCDHGEQLGDHYLLGKIGYFDESFRIPLVIKSRGQSMPGRIEDAFTESIDVMPTLIEWAGGLPPRACDGQSLVPLLSGNRPSNWRTELHYEFDFRDTHAAAPETDLGVTMDDCSLCVVSDAEWKYVHFTALPPLLFNLRNDPDQLRNLALDPKHQSIVAEYAQRALSWRLRHADKTLTHYRAGPNGLESRANDFFPMRHFNDELQSTQGLVRRGR
jgi:arylsulfatase A-like enzyme